MPEFTDVDELNCKPLTQKERVWITRLEKVLLACPSERLSALTIGDAALEIYDYSQVDLCENGDTCDGGARMAGIVLADIKSSIVIEGISG
ncbi:hypothetical protein G3489_19485 [Shewanella baltica]|uniref:hypothetical protein n=1 Tax=Shewanella baltica TaxID=62322 RepID=UPI00217E2ED1|nr:hypothetical protein [Shewanella baltica]MCS6271860.1 hypothetical protein [Shewanella baltica]